MKKALLIIDIQNDYFPKGAFPLWEAEKTLENIKKAIALAKAKDIPCIVVQHVAKGEAPFFVAGTHGVLLHEDICTLLPDAVVVTKSYADSFYETNLEEILAQRQITDLVVCGMMTQNCVTHTAISKSAEKYAVSIIPECCTTVNEPVHRIALNGISIRVALPSMEEAL